MDRVITRQFMEDRATVLDVLPVTWQVKMPGPYYCVTMKMSRIKHLVFSFESLNARDLLPVADFPERILKLDLSLNELVELQADTFQHLKNILELNVSFNVLTSIPGLTMLPNLLVLDLSYNAITHMELFKTCSRLIFLNLSHNKIRTIKDLPSHANLTQLHLNSNKLLSLDGIQNLPKLYELYVHNNEISSLLPLSASLSLNVLDASNNQISSLSDTLQVLRGLRRLTQLKLKGNPLAISINYTTTLRHQTSVRILDNCVLRDPSEIESSLVYYSLLRQSLDSLHEGEYTCEGLKDVVKKNLIKKLKSKQDAVENTIHHFHSSIMDLQEELIDFEDNLRRETENFNRYIDAIPQEDLNSMDPRKVQSATEQFLFTKSWERSQHGKRRSGNVPFKDVTESEEVLKAAAWLLSQSPK
ncbi:uncharacterized protein LOC134935301 [Pseudophryne corroboree]|uniref:uncharacterized protein LOC134935301 n=1 Tax=Pseudophryne corroboree TaxID=495146 RepID=UPI0030821E44